MVVWRGLLIAAAIAAADVTAEDKAGGGAPPVADEQPTDAGDAARLKDERRRAVAASIAQLGSPRFEVREEATRKLEQAGIEAVGPLLAAASGDSLEVTCRAIRALSAIFDSEDDATFDAAEAALDQLAESPNRSAAQRAQIILAPQDLNGSGFDERRYRRWKRAVIRIRELGGIVKPMNPADADEEITEMPPEKPIMLHVVLGEGWKGGTAGLVNLKRLAVRIPYPTVYVTKEANIPVEALDELQRKPPQLRIEGRGRAMLGISGDDSSPCRIQTVTPNSAAKKAGLRANDVILKYDGEELKSFRRLIEITGQHKPGDKVSLEIERDGETIVVEAELTGWEGDKSTEIKKQPPP
jgi:hypothetical protein